MEDPENIHEIAIAKMYLEDLACTAALHLEDKCKDYEGDFENYQNCRDVFQETLEQLDIEPWKDGKHFGDCTRFACSCARCEYETWLEAARKEIRKYMQKSKWYKIRRRIWYFIGRLLGVSKN